MDKNYKQKAKDFFRKEGFYVVLFLCLCIVTTVGAISLKKARNSESQPKVDNSNKEVSVNLDDKNVTNEMPNAERVDNSKSKDNTSGNANSNNNQAKAVATTNEVKFSKPVEGVLLRGYTYPKPVKIDDTTQKTIKGIDVNVKIGSEVKAAAEGVVESAENNGVEEGVTVVVKHANGLKTKYCNLDSKLSVKKGDKVTVDTVIGKVGETSKIYDKEVFGEHLNLQVINSNNEQVDPLKYFSYKSK
ncbi:peptidoglycan DD-metalloendopeptidase family protein [Clostridium paraputrificum]|uniref:peptidoglycan DD-metalloendopeptidase family protein n=1 Tax=Clostridium TaxID=1485 RepID=UPI003D33D404